jgi:predicted O-linked N-acetylglucosamine transferase (SPINDLY family)
MMGSSFASRVAGSLLNDHQLTGYIANNFDEYFSICIDAVNGKKINESKVFNTSRITNESKQWSDLLNTL